MLKYIYRRFSLVLPMLAALSLFSFAVIQLPPGDYVDTYVQNLARAGNILDQAQIDVLKNRYALDKPFAVQYVRWIGNIALRGDFGSSFTYKRAVGDILAERVPRTLAITLAGLLLAWLFALPIGTYSAVRQYSPLDYLFTFFGFVGLSIPAFLFAIVLVFTVYRYTGWAATGLFSAEFRDAAWSLARLLDMLKNLAIPLLVLASSSAAALIRIHRATLLDELKKQYVITARSKGVSELKVLFKYPVRVAINPLISTIGWVLPAAFGGEVVVSMVLNLPTTGPIMIESIMNEDMYLAGAIFMILSALTVIGTLVSDLLLGIVDPRIRLSD